MTETPYQRTLTALGDGTARQALALLAAFVAGHLTVREAVAAIAATIARANGHAVVLADVALAATLTQQLGKPVPVLGFTAPEGDLTRLSTAVDTILTDPRTILASDTEEGQREFVQNRVERLARNEPIDAAGRTFSEAVSRSPHVSGYTRQLEPDACELCQWLYKGGFVYPADQPMHQHPGCRCHPSPVGDAIGTTIPTTDKAKRPSKQRKRNR